MNGFLKQRYTLDQIFEMFRAKFTGEQYIKYDPKVEPQYYIIRQQRSDGTMLFTYELIHNALKPLIERSSHFKPEPPRDGMLPVYTIGQIRLATAYGMVELPCGKVPGQNQRVRIPVRVDWVPAPQGMTVKYDAVLD